MSATIVLQGLNTAELLAGVKAICGAATVVRVSDRIVRLGGMPALPDAVARERIALLADAGQVDCAFIAAPRPLTDFRLAVMDMDSTLITIECIDEIADMQGIKPAVAAITEAAMRGEIDFPQALRRRVGLLKGLPVEALQRVYDERLRPTPGAETMLAAFRAAGLATLVVSGGFTFFTSRLADRLALDDARANVLGVENGLLTGSVIGEIVDGEAKRQALLELAQTRSQELAGFVDGLFGDDEEMDMPEKAHEALDVLATIHSMFASTVALLEIEATPAEHRELIDLLRNFQKMTITADEEINRIIQSCKRARAQHIENLTFVPSRRFTAGPEMDDEDEDEWIEEEDPDDDHVLIYSPLNQTLTRNGVTVEIHIYKDSESDWILEVVDAGKNSHVWDDQFQTDQQAFDEAMRALDEEPLEFMEPTSGSTMN